MKTNSITKADVLRAVALVVSLLLLVSAVSAVGMAVPSPPHEVFGTVTDQDGDAVSGVTVTITDTDGNTVTTQTNSDGYYELKFPAEDADEGETLTVEVKSQDWTTTFSSGTSEEKNFDVTVQDDTDDSDGTDGGTDDGDDGGTDDGDDGGAPGGDDGGTDDGDDGGTDDGDDGGAPGGDDGGDDGGAPGGDDGTDDTDTPTETVTPTETATDAPDTPTETDTDAPSDETDSPTEAPPDTGTATDSPTPAERGVSIPGFGPVLAVIALVAASMLAARRSD